MTNSNFEKCLQRGKIREFSRGKVLFNSDFNKESTEGLVEIAEDFLKKVKDILSL